MSQLQDRIAQFRKMANDDPENELGHYRLGQLLAEAGEHEQAVQSYRRTLELSPHFSKVYHLLAQSLLRLDRRDEAIKVLREGFQVADQRGDRMPRDEMGRLLTELGETPPQTARLSVGIPESGGPGSFRCQRPGCMWGARARQLPKPPMNDETGRRIYDNVCADCWNEWLKNFSIKVINELHLDLSTEHGQEEYDRYMREFLGLD